MSDSHTNAKTLKMGVYLHTVNDRLSYFTCKCGHRSGEGPTELIRAAGLRHVCKDQDKQ